MGISNVNTDLKHSASVQGEKRKGEEGGREERRERVGERERKTERGREKGRR